jgi:hypothetical protein
VLSTRPATISPEDFVLEPLCIDISGTLNHLNEQARAIVENPHGTCAEHGAAKLDPSLIVANTEPIFNLFHLL